MRVANGVEALELTMNFMGNQSIIHPTLIWDNESVILVDAGMPGHLPAIREAMDKAGVSLNKLNKVIVTHQDFDHIGGLPEVLAALTDHKVQVYAHAEDKPYIEGDKPPIKMNPERVKAMLAQVPDEQRTVVEAMFSTPPKAHVDTTVDDGQVLPLCGGITVIFTPGHTPGHISLYLNQSKTLVTGDAMVASNGQLMGPSPNATPDMETATASLQKFTQFDIETVICYHGGIYTLNVNQRIAELARA